MDMVFLDERLILTRSLQNNLITSVPNGTLAGLKTLLFLYGCSRLSPYTCRYLQNNLITSLAGAAFTGLTALHQLCV